MESNLIAPGLAIVFTAATFVFTQIRAQRLDDRSAARETVETIAALNRALSSELEHLRDHIKEIDAQHKQCERERILLLEQLAGIRAVKQAN